jgi:hypothetical protein
MIPLEEGHWVKELAFVAWPLRILARGGRRMDLGPLAKETAPNPFGGVNSVLNVRAS